MFSNEEDINNCFIDVIVHLCIYFALSQFDGEEEIEELRGGELIYVQFYMELRRPRGLSSFKFFIYSVNNGLK